MATFGGFGTLLGGLLYSGFGIGGERAETILVAYAALAGGYMLIAFGKGDWLRFAIRPRADEALAIQLRSLDSRVVLFNYVSCVPVDHLIVAPGAIVVVETRPYIGDIVVRGDRWSRRRGIIGWLQLLSEGPLGNPTRDALRGVELIRKLLTDRFGAEEAARIPVEPVVVFTHPRVTLTIEDPTIPVMHARDCREHIRRVAAASGPSQAILKRLETQIIEEAALEAEPMNAGDAIERRSATRRPRRGRPTSRPPWRNPRK